MKKIIIKILLTLSIVLLGLLSITGNTYAEENNTETNKSSSGILVVTTEKIPGANCSKNQAKEGEQTRYNCYVAKGFGSVIIMLGNIIKYFTYIAALGAVLFIIINGIMYSMGGIDSGIKDEAKKRIAGTIIGLILLFLSGIILNMIAPWIYR